MLYWPLQYINISALMRITGYPCSVRIVEMIVTSTTTQTMRTVLSEMRESPRRGNERRPVIVTAYERLLFGSPVARLNEIKNIRQSEARSITPNNP